MLWHTMRTVDYVPIHGGTGEFAGADGSGNISTLIGKKHFGGKLTGELTLSSSVEWIKLTL